MSPKSKASNVEATPSPSPAATSNGISMEKLDDYRSADECMNRCLHLAKLAARTDLPVLVLGESGTGKTVIAQAIHRSSARHQAPFVSFNAAALTDTLLDSQLFGHEKGAFTGAERQVRGKFELAHEGTLFFDEISDLSLTGQAKILRAFDDGEFERLGGEGLHRADVRLITATCHPIRDFVAGRQFRRDLFYRINVISITQPPLRERMGDIPLLVEHYIGEMNERNGKNVKRFDDATLQVMQRYNWPGNVRELVNVVERAVVLARNETVMVDDLPENLRREDPNRNTLELPGASGSLRSALVVPERQIILNALEQHGWNRQKTAAALSINRTTLYKKMKKYDISFEKQLAEC